MKMLNGDSYKNMTSEKIFLGLPVILKWWLLRIDIKRWYNKSIQNC